MLAGVLVQGCELEAQLGARICAQDRETARIRQDRDASTAWQRLRRNELEDVAELLQSVRADHPRLAEQCLGGPV